MGVDVSVTNPVTIGAMTLQEYLDESGVSRGQLAELLGVSEVTVHRYLKKGTIPNAHVMPKVVAATGGKVQPNDFYQLPKKQRPKAV